MTENEKLIAAIEQAQAALTTAIEVLKSNAAKVKKKKH